MSASNGVLKQAAALERSIKSREMRMLKHGRREDIAVRL